MTFIVQSSWFFTYYSVEPTKETYIEPTSITMISEREVKRDIMLYGKDELWCEVDGHETKIGNGESWDNFKAPVMDRGFTKQRQYKGDIGRMSTKCRLRSVVCTKPLIIPVCQDAVYSKWFDIVWGDNDYISFRIVNKEL